MTDYSNLPTAPPDQNPEEQPATFIWDTSNPQSLINVVPEPVKDAMLRLVHERPDLCDLDEASLKKYVRAETSCAYTTTDNQLRFKFWLEFERALSQNFKMYVNNICAGVCSVEFFKKTFLKNNIKVCWMLCKPTEYLVKSDEALSFGIDEMRDILSMPNIKGKGDIDYKLINAKISIFKMLDARVHGAAVQRNLIYTKSEHKIVDTLSTGEREKLIEAQIQELEMNEKRLAEVIATSEPAILPDDVDL